MREAPSRLSLDEFVAELEAAPDRLRSLALRFAAGAELGELVCVVELIEAGHRHVAGLLRVGARIPLPRMPANLIALAESPDADIADAAIDALVHFPAPETLAVGRRLIEAGNWGAVELLAAATANEIRALPARFAGITDAELTHQIGMDVLDMMKARESFEPSLLVWMVEATPCSFCRHSAVQRLAAANAIPPDMIEALLYDCSDETRALVGGVQDELNG